MRLPDMKLLLSLLLLLLAGCSSFPFSSSDAETPPAPSGKPAPHSQGTGVSVAPEARKLIAEAQQLWDDSWSECRNAPKALEILDKAIAIDPLDAHARLLRGRALADLGYYEDAFDDATKSIRLHGNALAYATRASILQKQNHLEGALRDLDYAEKLDPEEPLILAVRAADRFLRGQNGSACDLLEQAGEKGLPGPWEKALADGTCKK